MFALLGGGGYAELASAHAGHVMRIPPSLSFEQAACICETYLTAYMNLFLYARLVDGETVLLHGGGGGVTTAAMQLVKTLAPRARMLVTASTGKVERVAALGADVVIDYKKEDFAEAVLRHTDKRGVDVILDHLGGSYLAQNVRSLAVGGRLAVIGVMGGRKAELDVGRVLVDRLEHHRLGAAAAAGRRESRDHPRLRARRHAALRGGAHRAAHPSRVSARAGGRRASGHGSRASTSASSCCAWGG